MDNVIYLLEVDGTWMAHFAGPHAADIEELFDTTTLPTAFTAKIAYEVRSGADTRELAARPRRAGSGLMSRRSMRRFYAQSDRIDTRKDCLIWERLSLEQARRMARECRQLPARWKAVRNDVTVADKGGSDDEALVA